MYEPPRGPQARPICLSPQLTAPQSWRGLSRGCLTENGSEVSSASALYVESCRVMKVARIYRSLSVASAAIAVVLSACGADGATSSPPRQNVPVLLGALPCAVSGILA